MKKEQTQTKTVQEKILSHLQKGRKLTRLKALNLFETISLPVFIHRLRKQGVDIQGEDIETTSGKTITRYFIKNAR